MRKPTRTRGLKARESRLAYMLLLPTVLVITFIVVFPLLWNIVLSLQPIRMAQLARVNLLDFSQFSLVNYRRLFTVYGLRFFTVLRTTVVYATLSTLLAMVLGLWAAMTVRDAFPGRNAVRGFMLFPYIAPVVSLAFVWKLMLDKTIGIVPLLLKRLGIPPISFLTLRSYPVEILGITVPIPVALITVILFEAWRYFPFTFLFFLARLQAIPQDLYEAAAVDGASPWQRFRYITLPQLYTVAGTLFLLRFIWTFNKFEDIFLLNGGAGGTTVLSIEVYNWLFGRRNVGLSAALAVIMALLLTGMALVYLRWFARRMETA